MNFDIIALASLGIAAATAGAAFINSLKASSQKAYAAQRDFQEIEKSLIELRRGLDIASNNAITLQSIERDSAHTKNSIKTMSANLSESFTDIERQIADLKGDIKEMKASVISFSQRLDSILMRVETASGVWGKRE